MISIFRKGNLKLTVISSDYFGHLFGKKFTMSTTSRLAQLVEHETLNLRVVGSSPTLGDLLFLTFSHPVKRKHNNCDI